MLFHGVAQVHPHTAPGVFRGLDGRVSITFRQSELVAES